MITLQSKLIGDLSCPMNEVGQKGGIQGFQRANSKLSGRPLLKLGPQIALSLTLQAPKDYGQAPAEIRSFLTEPEASAILAFFGVTRRRRRQ